MANTGSLRQRRIRKLDNAIPTGDLAMDLVPREEWRQIFQDTWRRHRDFFYDPQMHGVDWEALKVQYGALIEDARSTLGCNFCSLQSGRRAQCRTYLYLWRGPDQVKPVQTGFLGIDWELQGDKFRIKRIIRPAAWDTEVRSPFDTARSPDKGGGLYPCR